MKLSLAASSVLSLSSLGSEHRLFPNVSSVSLDIFPLSDVLVSENMLPLIMAETFLPMVSSFSSSLYMVAG